jgi:hypothetical protein
MEWITAIEQGRYTHLDVADALSRFMVNDLPSRRSLRGSCLCSLGARVWATRGFSSNTSGTR